MKIHLEVGVSDNFFSPHKIRGWMYIQGFTAYRANLSYGIHLEGILFLIPHISQKRNILATHFSRVGLFQLLVLYSIN